MMSGQSLVWIDPYRCVCLHNEPCQLRAGSVIKDKVHSCDGVIPGAKQKALHSILAPKTNSLWMWKHAKLIRVEQKDVEYSSKLIIYYGNMYMEKIIGRNSVWGRVKCTNNIPTHKTTQLSDSQPYHAVNYTVWVDGNIQHHSYNSSQMRGPFWYRSQRAACWGSFEGHCAPAMGNDGKMFVMCGYRPTPRAIAIYSYFSLRYLLDTYARSELHIMKVCAALRCTPQALWLSPAPA